MSSSSIYIVPHSHYFERKCTCVTWTCIYFESKCTCVTCTFESKCTCVTWTCIYFATVNLERTLRSIIVIAFNIFDGNKIYISLCTSKISFLKQADCNIYRFVFNVILVSVRAFCFAHVHSITHCIHTILDLFSVST